MSEKGSENDTGDGSRSRALNKGTEDIRNQLAEHLGALRFVNGTISVCVQALQQQDADMDSEIALVVKRTAGDKLDATIGILLQMRARDREQRRIQKEKARRLLRMIEPQQSC